MSNARLARQLLSPEGLNTEIEILICSLRRLINILAVRAYGEAEFWLSGGKVILIFSLFFYTFITMVGGNPENDVYGFRYFGGGRAFQDQLYPGETKSLAKFEGFLAALWQAAFTVVGMYTSVKPLRRSLSCSGIFQRA